MAWLVRLLAGAAVVLAGVLLSLDLIGVTRAASKGWPSPLAAEARNVRAHRLDPAVFRRLANVLPRDATYDVAISPGLRASERGQQFSHMLNASLLPRLAVIGGTPSWHIRWGVSAPAHCCRVSLDVGRPNRSSPPVYLFKSD